MSVATVRQSGEYEQHLQRFLYERAEEARAVRVGEKEVSEQAAIIARYADLFTREQLEVLRAEEEEAPKGDAHERIHRLRATCESGIVHAELAERYDALENAILAARIRFRDEELPLRTAQARLAVIADYAERDDLGKKQALKSASFNDERLELLQAREALEAELTGEPDPVRRSEKEKGIRLRKLSQALALTSDRSTASWRPLRQKWLDRLLGEERDERPSSSHVPYMRRLSPLDSTYTKERSVEVCMRTLERLGFALADEPNIRLDLEDRPQKSPRACVIAADAPKIVHLITRAQGGLHDYQALLHEAGHALHYAGVNPELPYTFRMISRDHALTEIYSYILEAITREPEWHAEHFGLSDEEAAENAEATVFLELLLFRRYAAKLRFELEFWNRFSTDGGTPEGYMELLTQATGIRYRRDAYLSDMDAGFYTADYLRAWIRSAQLRTYLQREVGEDWWRNPETGERLRALFREGTKPTSEKIAGRLGFRPLDTGPLLDELSSSA